MKPLQFISRCLFDKSYITRRRREGSFKMQDYLKISLILSTFGLLKETRPSESFIADFIVDFKNITAEQINQDIFPIGTYSYLVQLIIIFLVTDMLRYKPLIILLGASGVTIWSMLLWTNSVLGLQFVEVIYGTYCATEIAYYSYIYAKTEREHYQAVTSHTRAAILVGRFVAGVSSQLLVFFHVMNYRQLNYLTLITQILAFVWAFFIPRVETSTYFNRNTGGKWSETFRRSQILEAFNLIWNHFRTSYANKVVVLWSIYYAVVLCFNIQITAYIQILWMSIDDSQEVIYNGAVDAILTLLGACFAILAGKIHINFLKKSMHSLLVLILMSSVQGVFVVLAANSQTLLACYIFYICFGASYAFGITICATEIAKNLAEDTFGLVFGFNTLIALTLQTAVTLSVVSYGFQLSPSGQYQVYGYAYVVLAAVYLVTLFVDIMRRSIRRV
ncbi:thiamine transporter 1-like [Bradysia coprophila]|uniref:thiamine transporter 1-like n=1 Tax=Bradysia coprophila TaxID=38358 RepID=UPI00187DBD9E|nr:thiamine transporter 1-like [Bradysia coprophila]